MGGLRLHVIMLVSKTVIEFVILFLFVLDRVLDPLECVSQS